MTGKPHRLLSLRLSTFTALVAVAALALGILALRNGGSASSSSTAPTVSSAPATSTRTVSTNMTPTQIYSNTHTGVVKITTDSGLGTGILLDKSGDILTNDHVVQGANTFNVTFDSSDSGHSAKLVGTDPTDDLAIVKIDPSGLDLKPLTLADSSTVQVGDTVFALGNPFGYTNSFSEGIVSGLGRSITSPNGFGIDNAIQTDASINPGNSGGPLLDANGEVIGVNAQIATGGQTAAGGEAGNNGVGFAIPINTAKGIAAQLEQSGHVSHAYLGVGAATVAGSLQGSLTGAQSGALIEKVQSGSPAAQAGLKAGTKRQQVDGASILLGGDVIQAINGKKVITSDDLASAISSMKPGDKASVQLVRGGKQVTVAVTLGKQPSQAPTG
jgi:S1-C subfamily serine protease